MGRIVLLNNNRLAVDGHYLCGHTSTTGSESVVEVFNVTVDHILRRLNSVVCPVTRSPSRRKIARNNKDMLKVLTKEKNHDK
jgi:uncharacterized membrane protein YfbV (UPF0208 family)